MNKLRKEKVTSALLNFIKNHKRMKYPVLTLLTGYLCLEHGWGYVCANPKRLCGMLLALSFFAISSSFTFPQNIAPPQEDDDITYHVTYAQTADSDQTLQSEAVEEIDDMELLEEIGDVEFDSNLKIDRYSAEEILNQNYDIITDETQEDMTDSGEIHFRRDDWNLVLINKQHPVPDDYSFNLGTLMGSVQCDERIFEDLLNMLQAAGDDGVFLMICSAYRDESRQQLLFERKIQKYMQCGLSYADAYKKTSGSVTVPGASEHQIGLALDIVTGYHTLLNEAFGDTEAGIWLNENSYLYGFILRYPKGKEDITGINYEPWHFRYVGTDAAKIMKEEELTLEEFVEQKCIDK